MEFEQTRLYNGAEKQNNEMPNRLRGDEVITLIVTEDDIFWIARPAEKMNECGEYRHTYLAKLATDEGLIENDSEIIDGAVINLSTGRITGSGSFGNLYNPMDTIPTEVFDQFIAEITSRD